jgi:hypothetical protein
MAFVLNLGAVLYRSKTLVVGNAEREWPAFSNGAAQMTIKNGLQLITADSGDSDALSGWPTGSNPR